jgi:glycosyltransferase involved in cell wall biosynthesis
MMRYCKSVNADFDLFFGVGGGMDYGCRGIQYGAYAPASTLMKVLSKDIKIPTWYYLFKKSVMHLCEWLSHFSAESLRSNITLAASEWTGERMVEMYPTLEYEVLYPPVNGPTMRTPWVNRQEGFLCIARIIPEKMIDQAIAILKRVREKGFPVSIHIVGRPDHPSYFKNIQELQRQNSSWVFIHGILPKDELFSLMDQHKYGINAAVGEPFGIAVAEMVGAGAIVFVSNRGGHTEIVKSPQLIYRDIEDAVDKIIGVLGQESLQKDLLGTLDRQSDIFSTQAFCDGIRNVVDTFFTKK